MKLFQYRVLLMNNCRVIGRIYTKEDEDYVINALSMTYPSSKTIALWEIKK